jgi:hypothetical protein
VPSNATSRHVDSHGLVWESCVTPVADPHPVRTACAVQLQVEENSAAPTKAGGATLQGANMDVDDTREGTMVSAVEVVQHATVGGVRIGCSGTADPP